VNASSPDDPPHREELAAYAHYQLRLTSAAERRRERRQYGLHSFLRSARSWDIVNRADGRVMQSYVIPAAGDNGVLANRIRHDLDALRRVAFEEKYGIQPAVDFYTRQAANPGPVILGPTDKAWKNALFWLVITLLVCAFFALVAFLLGPGPTG
jgi:hypothetical protein